MTTHHADDDTLAYIAKLREELAKEKEKVAKYFAVAKNLECQVKWKDEEIDTLRPAAEALKTAVKLRFGILFLSASVEVSNYDQNLCYNEMTNEGDPLAATIRAINRAAEAVKEET